MAPALAFGVTNGTDGAVAAVLETGVEDGQTDSTVVGSARAGSQQATDGGSRGRAVASSITVGDACGLAVAKVALLRNVQRQLVWRRGSSAKEGGLLRAQHVVLLVLLLLGLLGHLAQIQSQRVVTIAKHVRAASS